VKPHRPHNLK